MTATPAESDVRTVLEAFRSRHALVRIAPLTDELGDPATGFPARFVVDFPADAIPGLIGLAGLEFELSEMLGGREVHLVTQPALQADLAADATTSAKDPYAAE